MKYGRSDDEWDELVDAATDHLIEVARDRNLTNYTDLSSQLVRRTGHSGFDFKTARDQAAVGALLADVIERTYAEIGAMLSALVVLKATGDPGDGFYRYAKQLGLFKPGMEKFEVFQAQVRLVHEKYARPRP